MSEFKLFVWDRPYRVKYGSSLLVAVAQTLEEAKSVALAGRAYEFGHLQEGFKASEVSLGEPSRIVDIPCAEWHEWCE